MTLHRTFVAFVAITCFCCVAIGAPDTATPAVKKHVRAARSFEDNNDFVSAIKEYDLALAIATKKENIYVYRAGAKFKNNDFPGAIKDYSAAISLNSKDGTLYLMRGLSYSLLQPADKKMACTDFATAAKLGAEAEVIPGQSKWCAGAQ